VDIRTLPHYTAAKATGSLAATDLSINPDTGFPVLSLGFPIVRDGGFVGFAGANITVDVLSLFLDRHRASPHSTTTIVERGGAIIAYPDRAKQVQMVEGRLAVARVANIADDDLREAYRLRAQLWMGDNFMFRSPLTGKELAASFNRFPEGFPRPWETVILTPTDDFVGPLKAANRQMVAVIAVLTVLELALIYALSTRLSRPIEGVSRQLRAMETLSFESLPVHGSRARVREIAQLQDAVARVRASLRSFARYAPEEIVREVAASGREGDPLRGSPRGDGTLRRSARLHDHGGEARAGARRVDSQRPLRGARGSRGSPRRLCCGLPRGWAVRRLRRARGPR
jgi:hypothetical protein